MLRRFDKKNYKLKKKSYKKKQDGDMNFKGDGGMNFKGAGWITKKKNSARNNNLSYLHSNNQYYNRSYNQNYTENIQKPRSKLGRLYSITKKYIKEKLSKSKTKINNFIEKIKEMIKNFKKKSNFNKDESKVFINEIAEVVASVAPKTNNVSNANNNTCTEPIEPTNLPVDLHLYYIKYYINLSSRTRCNKGKYIKYDYIKKKYCCSNTSPTLDEMIEHCDYLLQNPEIPKGFHHMILNYKDIYIRKVPDFYKKIPTNTPTHKSKPIPNPTHPGLDLTN
jgi:hypothetical protein